MNDFNVPTGYNLLFYSFVNGDHPRPGAGRLHPCPQLQPLSAPERGQHFPGLHGLRQVLTMGWHQHGENMGIYHDLTDRTLKHSECYLMIFDMFFSCRFI